MEDSGTDEEIPLPNVKTAILSKAFPEFQCLWSPMLCDREWAESRQSTRDVFQCACIRPRNKQLTVLVFSFLFLVLRASSPIEALEDSTIIQVKTHTLF